MGEEVSGDTKWTRTKAYNSLDAIRCLSSIIILLVKQILTRLQYNRAMTDLVQI